MTEEIDWGELGRDWWFEAGANCGASEQQIIFAACRHKGMTATGSARVAGYAGDDASIDRPVTVQPTPQPLWVC